MTDPLRDELAWLGRALGPVRDNDVRGEHLRLSLDQLVAAGSTALVRGPVRRRLATHTRTGHRTAQAAAVQALTSPRYRRLIDRLAKLADDPPWTEAAQAPVHEVLAPRVLRDVKRLEKQVASALAGDGDESPEERLHEVRKAAKRARYAAEPLVAAYGKDAAGFVKQAKRIQAVLGEHHDTVAARAGLRQLADQAVRNGEDGFTYGVLHEREQARAAELAAGFTTMWGDLPTRKWRRWLA